MLNFVRIASKEMAQQFKEPNRESLKWFKSERVKKHVAALSKMKDDGWSVNTFNKIVRTIHVTNCCWFWTVLTSESNTAAKLKQWMNPRPRPPISKSAKRKRVEREKKNALKKRKTAEDATGKENSVQTQVVCKSFISKP